MRRLAKAALLGSLALSATVARAPDAHAQRAVVSLPVEQYKLDNGLEVVLHEDHRTPVIAVNIWYHVGSKDEPAGKNGFAHLFEHVMFQGSRHVGEDAKREGKSPARADPCPRRNTFDRKLAKFYVTKTGRFPSRSPQW